MSPAESGWGLHKQLYEGLAARPGLFTMQETALLGFLAHKQYKGFGSTKQSRKLLGAMWGMSGERIRQIIVGLERKRALSRLGRPGSTRTQEYAVTYNLAFAWWDDRSKGGRSSPLVDKPAWQVVQAGLVSAPSGLGNSQGGDLYDLSDHVQEATAAPRPLAPLFDGVPLQHKYADPRHGRLLSARQQVEAKLRDRFRGLIRQLLHNPTVAAEFNGGAPITDEAALDHALRGLCARRQVAGWDEYLDLLRGQVSYEWSKFQVMRGERDEYPSRAARRRRRRES